MLKSERKQKFGHMLAKARCDVEKSQEYMALELDISRKTVSNWERGLSSPTLQQLTDWFEVLGLNPMKYIYSLMYPDLFDNIDILSDEELDNALVQLFSDMPPIIKRQLLFLFSAQHGSSPVAKMQEWIADLHTPIGARYNVANLVEINYYMAQEMGVLVCDNHVMPDMTLFHDSILQGRDATIKNQNGYIDRINKD